ncbi:phosphotriesterase [Georgenia yuyongxinii]|uniref:Phosphotriesterase n=1 Tax=Georgenia yuyongxinii TaxID=2589797 RepID=A0A5B8C1K6_9MICO|nr:phosphotriesterase [Georgenia yuyongxinii]QDC24569.1 phosphotriesterase [Georgenia yuyongxinii]
MTRISTVTGPIASTDLGVTLTHEHVLNDVTSWSHATSSTGWDPEDYANRPVAEDILWDLRQDPFGNRDNCLLEDRDAAVEEVSRYARLGGRTIIDTTGLGAGRDLIGLREISRRTGVTIIAGTGYYLESSHPPGVDALSREQIAQRILDDLSEGEDGIRPGVIGEIGVSSDFTAAERRSLEGAFLAQRETGLPVQVHLPGWFRRADEVLDIAEGLGVDPTRIVLCHMGPSGDDVTYQERLLGRGAWVQYDMIGMEVFYADQQVQCPSDEENARWLARLVERGHLSQLLISQDIFLKSLLRRHGGPGYGHILQYFVPRLHRHGLDQTVTDQLLIDNPRALFDGRG